jgi:hypothetical protein
MTDLSDLDLGPLLAWDKSKWDDWRLKSSNLVYFHPAYKRDIYWIPLDQCTSSAEVLDWIMQLAGKTWASNACLGGLIHALDNILKPQQPLQFGPRYADECGQHSPDAATESYRIAFSEAEAGRKSRLRNPMLPAVTACGESSPPPAGLPHLTRLSNGRECD